MYSYSATQYPIKPLLLAMLSAFVPLAAGQALPGAGSLLQQVRPIAPPIPSSSNTRLRVQAAKTGALPTSAPFPVKSVRLTGNTVFDTAFLLGLMGTVDGTSQTLAELEARVAHITVYYRNHGYPLARAIIPAQEIKDGIVEVDVIEARYGKIRLDNNSRVRDYFLQDSVESLHGGQIIEQTVLDHDLLLLSDIPGVALNATLMPGDAVGTSDLLLTITPMPLAAVDATFDNDGNYYTGRARLGATVNVNNPLNRGDVLSASVLSSGSGMNYARLAYDVSLNGLGTRLGTSYSLLHYSLGQSLAPLIVHGIAQVESVWARHTLLRSPERNLYGQLQFDQLLLRDHIDRTLIRSDRHLNNWTASLNGDARDALLAGGVTSWNLALTSGRVGFDDAQAQASDAKTVQIEGKFVHWNLNVNRLQQLDEKNGLYAALSLQRANTNLDISQKMTVGGPNSVRAYDVGAVSGDTGYVGTLEWRHEIGAAWRGQLQTLAFVDNARMTVNKSAWIAGNNTATLQGVGVGLNWSGPQQWSVKAFVARRTGTLPALLTDTTKTRGWIEINHNF